MVESVLRGCGYRTGLYTSPHLVDVRERVRIGGYVHTCVHVHVACPCGRQLLDAYAPACRGRRLASLAWQAGRLENAMGTTEYA